MKRKKWLYAAAGILVALGVGGAYVWNSQQGLTAETQIIQPEDLEKTLMEEGVVWAGEDLSVTPQISGQIKTLLVKEGQYVEAGAALFEMETQTLSLQKAQAEQNAAAQWAQANAQAPLIAQAQQEAEKLAQELTKLEPLVEAGALAQQEFDQARFAWESAQRSHEAALKNQAYLQALARASQLQAKQLEGELAHAVVTAPAAGHVKNLVVKAGSFVGPQMETCLISVGEGLKIESLVQTEHRLSLNVGDPVLLQMKQGEDKVTGPGRIKEIYPYAVEEISSLGLVERRVPVILEPMDESLPLEPGYDVDVVFTLASAQKALSVPKTAIFAYEEGHAVWVVDHGRATIRQVKQGFKSTYSVVVLEGLSEGEEILVNATQEGLEEGIKIQSIS